MITDAVVLAEDDALTLEVRRPDRRGPLPPARRRDLRRRRRCSPTRCGVWAYARRARRPRAAQIVRAHAVELAAVGRPARRRHAGGLARVRPRAVERRSAGSSVTTATACRDSCSACRTTTRDRWMSRLRLAGATVTAPPAVEFARIEAGRPEFLSTWTPTRFRSKPASKDRAISFTKGCYVGQEVIVRIVHRGGGRVARKRLVGLRVDGDCVPAARAGGPPTTPATSATSRARRGRRDSARAVALAYVHREFVEPGTTLAVDCDGTPVPVTVSALPDRVVAVRAVGDEAEEAVMGHSAPRFVRWRLAVLALRVGGRRRRRSPRRAGAAGRAVQRSSRSSSAPFHERARGRRRGRACRLGVRRPRRPQHLGGRGAGLRRPPRDDLPATTTGRRSRTSPSRTTARTLVYVRGGAANRAGEIPNPTSDAAGAEQAVWAVPVAGGAPRQLGVGGVAGDLAHGRRSSRSCSAARSGWPAVTGTPAAVQVARDPRSARGRSPGRPTARSSRSSAAAARTRSSASLDRGDRRADLARAVARHRRLRRCGRADGARVAFIRRPPVRDRVIFIPEREGPPWSVRVAEVATGAGREVWRAEPGRGSVFQPVEFGPQLAWTADDRLVFPWERDGWKHLYSVPVAGGDGRRCSRPGAFEVDDVSYAPDGRTAVVSSNQDDIDRRHLWRVTTSGAASPVALTPGRGLEWNPAVLADGTSVAFVRADARRPGQPAARLPAAHRASFGPEAIPAAFPAAALVEPAGGAIAAADGMTHPRRRSSGRRDAGAAGEKRPGAHLLPRRIAAPDAARLELPQLLPQRLRLQSDTWPAAATSCCR